MAWTCCLGAYLFLHWPININIMRLIDKVRMTGMRINSCLSSFLDTAKINDGK